MQREHRRFLKDAGMLTSILRDSSVVAARRKPATRA